MLTSDYNMLSSYHKKNKETRALRAAGRGWRSTGEYRYDIKGSQWKDTSAMKGLFVKQERVRTVKGE